MYTFAVTENCTLLLLPSKAIKMWGLLLYIYSDINLNQPLCYFGSKGIVILFLSVPSCAPDIQNSMSKDQKYLNGFGSQISVTRGRVFIEISS